MQSKRTTRRSIRILAAALAISPAIYGQTLNTLYSFSHNELGYQPRTGVTIGPNGQLYGTSLYGGASGLGVAYELLPPASSGAAWTYVVLHSFNSNSGDGPPTSGLLLGSTGVLYGTTGVNNVGGGGTVFQLKPPTGAGNHWSEAVLHAFTGLNGDGYNPEAAPIFGPHKALYGTTYDGGLGVVGAVYRLAPPSAQGGAWTEQVLYSFTGGNGGGAPSGPLALGANGTIFGTTGNGGSDPLAGMAFQLAPPTAPGGSWMEATLYSFGSQPGDSGLPNGLVLGPNGVLYGTAEGSTAARACFNGCGTVFQLTPPPSPGGAWTETILHTFTGLFPNADGSQPSSTPVLGPGGVLYGTTLGGGTANQGTIFEMVPPSAPGGTWTEVVLYSFAEGAGGVFPNAVTLGPDGNLYGTTESSGANNLGTVFQLVLK